MIYTTITSLFQTTSTLGFFAKEGKFICTKLPSETQIPIWKEGESIQTDAEISHYNKSYSNGTQFGSCFVTRVALHCVKHKRKVNLTQVKEQTKKEIPKYIALSLIAP